MADELYRSYSLEKSKNDDGEIITSGSMTIWEDTPDFPLSIGEHFRPVSSSPLLTVEKLSVKDNVVGTLNGKPVRQWQITIEGKNGEQDGSQSENNVKYTFIIADNKKSGTMEVVNTGSSPSLRLEVGDTFAVPGIGNVRCTKITGNDEYTESGTRKWTTIYEWTDGNGESDTKYNFSIERNGDNTISTGSKIVTNSGNSPSNVALAETITVPGVGALPCVKVSGSDDYDENGNHIWTVTHEGSNAPNVTPAEHNTKYNINVERNSDNEPIITGSKTVTNSGDSPSNLALTEIESNSENDPITTGSEVVTNSGDTPSNLALTEIESNSENDPITTGSEVVTNSGDTPSNLVLDENLNLPGVGDIPLVKVSASDDYDDNGNHVWTVTYEGSNASDATQTEHDTKYNISIERNNDNELIITGSKTVTNSGDSPSNLTLTEIESNSENDPITTGSEVVTNSGDTPSNLVLAENLNLPGVGDIPLVKVSASDDYDDDGTRKWTVTYDATNAPSAGNSEAHDTKYNFSIERNNDNELIITGSKTVTNSGDTPSNLALTEIESNSENDPITTGSEVVTNSGDTPSNLVLAENLNLPGVGDIPLVKVSGSDDYDDDGSHIWTVTYDGSNASSVTPVTHDTKYNFSIENNNNEVVKTGSKTVIISGNNLPTLTVGETINVPGIGNVKCVKVSGNDDYDDDGTRKWTVVYDCTDAPQEQTTSSNIRYSINIEKNSDGVVVYTGTKEITSSTEPTTTTAIGDKLTFPLIGSVPCTRIYSNSNSNGTWTLTIECSSESESGSGEGGGEGGTSTSLPETEVETTHEINGTTARTVAGQLIILKRSDTPITKQTVTIYTQDGSSVANPGSSYRGGICISEHISKETIKNNGVVVSSYYKHVIEVEA